jgi:hypothetical protein
VVKAFNYEYPVLVLRVRSLRRLNPCRGLKTGKLLHVCEIQYRNKNGAGLGEYGSMNDSMVADFRVSDGVGQQPRDSFLISFVCSFVQSIR